jgi:hypothetical protein
MKIKDFEYGCRDIVAMYFSEKDAEELIKFMGNQQEVKFWNGSKEMLYTIEEWTILCEND